MELLHSNIYSYCTVNYRKWKSIGLPDFSAFIESSLRGFSPSDPLEDNISLLNTVLLSGLDSFAPIKSRSVAFVWSVSWYNVELCSQKAACRDHILEYKAEIVSVRSQYFSQITDKNLNNPKKLPQLCNRFLDHFSSKIANVCKCITSVVSASALSISNFSATIFSNLSSLDLVSLGNVVSQMKAATSIVDPITNCLFKSCFASLCPVVLSTKNHSLLHSKSLL